MATTTVAPRFAAVHTRDPYQLPSRKQPDQQSRGWQIYRAAAQMCHGSLPGLDETFQIAEGLSAIGKSVWSKFKAMCDNDKSLPLPAATRADVRDYYANRAETSNCYHRDGETWRTMKLPVAEPHYDEAQDGYESTDAYVGCYERTCRRGEMYYGEGTPMRAASWGNTIVHSHTDTLTRYSIERETTEGEAAAAVQRDGAMYHTQYMAEQHLTRSSSASVSYAEWITSRCVQQCRTIDTILDERQQQSMTPAARTRMALNEYILQNHVNVQHILALRDTLTIIPFGDVSWNLGRRLKNVLYMNYSIPRIYEVNLYGAVAAFPERTRGLELVTYSTNPLTAPTSQYPHTGGDTIMDQWGVQMFYSETTFAPMQSRAPIALSRAAMLHSPVYRPRNWLQMFAYDPLDGKQRLVFPTGVSGNQDKNMLANIASDHPPLLQPRIHRAPQQQPWHNHTRPEKTSWHREYRLGNDDNEETIRVHIITCNNNGILRNYVQYLKGTAPVTVMASSFTVHMPGVVDGTDVNASISSSAQNEAVHAPELERPAMSYLYKVAILGATPREHENSNTGIDAHFQHLCLIKLAIDASTPVAIARDTCKVRVSHAAVVAIVPLRASPDSGQTWYPMSTADSAKRQGILRGMNDNVLDGECLIGLDWENMPPGGHVATSAFVYDTLQDTAPILYKVGAKVMADTFDDAYEKACTSGIHAFLTPYEPIGYAALGDEDAFVPSQTLQTDFDRLVAQT